MTMKNQDKQTAQPRPSARLFRTRTMVSVAMLSAVALALSFLEFQVPLSPSFAKMDFSDLPALIATFALGPAAGVMVEAVKNGLHLLATTTGGVGELANFLIGSSLVFCAGLIYHLPARRTKRGAVIGCLAGTAAMAATAGIVNHFILLPMFSKFVPLEQLIAFFSELLPFIQSQREIIFYHVIPFNLIKGAVISVLTLLLYKRLSPILKGR